MLDVVIVWCRQSQDVVRRWGLGPRLLQGARERPRPSQVRTVVSGRWSGRLTRCPDAREQGWRHIIGEAKSRHYRGRVTSYELYQATLCLGMAHRLYRRPIRVILLYGCGRLIPLDFDEELYRRLLALIPQCGQPMG